MDIRTFSPFNPCLTHKPLEIRQRSEVKKQRIKISVSSVFVVIRINDCLTHSCLNHYVSPTAAQIQKSKKPKPLSRLISTFHSSFLRDNHYYIFLQRPICPIFRLQQHRPTLQALQTMPLSSFYIQDYPTRNHINRLRQHTMLIIEILLKVSSNTDASLGAILLPMYAATIATPSNQSPPRAARRSARVTARNENRPSGK